MRTESKPDVSRLYVDTIHVTAQPYDWTEGFGESWDFIEAPTCPDCGEYARWISGDDLAELLSDESREQLSGADETWSAWRCPNAACEQFGQGFDRFGDGAEGPMMSYFYPLPERDEFDESAAEKIADLPLCIVRWEDGGYALALTGGGMDLSWEIAGAFIRLGYLPPLAYCDLPQYAGLEIDDRRSTVISACLRSCEVAQAQAQRMTERLNQLLSES